MSSSSDSESHKIRRPHKRSSHRDKNTRSKSRRRSSSDSSTSSYSSYSSYKRSRKKHKRKRRKEETKSGKYERRKKHTGDADRDDATSSDERGRKGKKGRRSKKRRKKDSEAKASGASSSKVHDETIGDTHSDDKGDGIVDDAKAVTATTPQPAESKDSNSAFAAKPTKSKGPMTQQQYLELQSQIRDVIDPHTGRTRWMRGTGEIVERIVSKEEHSRLNQSATLGDGRGFARDIARVAAMNRNGS